MSEAIKEINGLIEKGAQQAAKISELNATVAALEQQLGAIRNAAARSGDLLAVRAWRVSIDANGGARAVASPSPAYVKRALIVGAFDATLALQGLDDVTYDFSTPVGLMLEGGGVLYCDMEGVDEALALIAPMKEKKQ